MFLLQVFQPAISHLLLQNSYLGDSAENYPWRPERYSNLPEVTQQILILRWDFCPEPASGKTVGLSRERWNLGQEPFPSTELALTEVTHTQLTIMPKEELRGTWMQLKSVRHPLTQTPQSLNLHKSSIHPGRYTKPRLTCKGHGAS